MNATELASAERRRCIGLVLRKVGEYRLSGHHALADAFDQLATEMEHGPVAVDDGVPATPVPAGERA